MKPGFTPILPIAAALLMASVGQANAAEATKGSAKAELCAPCHGAAGISHFVEVPHLAGPQRDYLITEMEAFRRATDMKMPTRHWNRRREPIMDHQTTGLAGADIDNLAAYFTAQACALPKTMGDPTLPTLARRCVSCHGDEGKSTIATVPHLAGQQRRYLENQLRAFRDYSGKDGAERRTRIDPIMGHQSMILGDADIAAIAAYFSGRRCR
ncbi:MAG: c-type cytochrome [Rhodospirillales bacterium]|nr:c-type cytochrome [Rhodospirillales bacterium]